MRKWFIKYSPDKDAPLKSRWLTPIAPRLTPPSIWHFNRRSIARGLALGLFAAFILPIGQIVLAVLLASTVRANVLVASAATLITNPLTFPPIYYAAYRAGSFVLEAIGGRDASPDVPGSLAPSMTASMGTASLSTFVGLTLFAILSSLVAFAGVHLAWRLSLIWRWQRRRGNVGN